MNIGLAPLPPCIAPTLYFIGVTTGSSSIMKVFPKWSDILGLSAQIRGYDAPLHAPAAYYDHVVRHIKADPLAMGALVTTHKIDLLAATRDQFEYLDPYAKLCDEISCISKRDGRLEGHAKDPITSGPAWQAFVPQGYWDKTNGHVLCLGAGGAAIAISVYLAERPERADRPRKFIAVDVNQPRLDSLKAILNKLNTDIEFEFVCNRDAHAYDSLLAGLPPGSIVINATGMGKDRPGSPISDQAMFPHDGLVWELNYRGALDFLHQAHRQAQARHLHVEDGWVYFLHGWSQVIKQVFHLDLTPALFDALDKAAAPIRA
ncbi:MAG: shikimate dehydrogenase family protein [Aggregatilineales bacterium]